MKGLMRWRNEGPNLGLTSCRQRPPTVGLNQPLKDIGRIGDQNSSPPPIKKKKSLLTSKEGTSGR